MTPTTHQLTSYAASIPQTFKAAKTQFSLRLRGVPLPLMCSLAASFLLLTIQPGHAGSATWKSNPVNSQWYNPNNWTPSTVPDGTTDIAAFGATTIPAVGISGSSDGFIVLKGITFNSDASVYILTLPPGFNSLTLQDGGVVNNSGKTQNFVINAGGNTHLTFQDATAGNDVSYNMIGSTELDFTNTATAGKAAFTCNNLPRGTFSGSATAGSASFTLNGTSNINFINASSADNGIFVLNGSESGGASITFTNGGRAGRGTFTINGTGKSSNTVYVYGFQNSSADAAVFTANGAMDTSHSPGVVMLLGGDPASATFIANAGLNGGNGGLVYWRTNFRSKARVEVFGSGNGDVTNGTLDLTGLGVFSTTSAFIGSLEGTGLVELGKATLTVGTNNLSTTFSGTIHDAGGGTNGSGSLAKTGRANLTLTRASTYTGHTTVSLGSLIVTNRSGSATGTGPVAVKGGVLAGTGKISGAVTIASPTKFGTLSPGAGGRPGRLTILSTLTFNGFGTYNADLNSTSVTADQVVAKGVTIANGATILLTDLGTATLTPGTTFTIISNAANTSPIAGTFSNLPNNSTVTVGSNTYKASYTGGTGNDLTLTVQ